MNLPREGHAHYQGLASAHLDGLLAPAEERELSEHLAECSTCRGTLRDYRTQRALMATLNAPPPPRDLWARTAAALDHEMARAPRASGRAGSRHTGPTASRPAPGSRWLGLTAVTSVLLAGAVVVTQMQASLAPSASPADVAARATPFDVTPQDMSVYDFTAHGVAVYQTRITEACPPPQIDCTSVQLPTNPVIQIQGNADDLNLGMAVNSRSGRLALVTGGAAGAETVSVLLLPPYRTADATQAPVSPTGGDSSSPTSGTPKPVSTNPPSASPAPTPKPTPKPTKGGPSPTPTPGSTATPPASDSPKPHRTHRPTPVPTEPATTNAPTGSGDPGTTEPTAPASAPDTTPATSNGTASEQPDEAAMSIADGVVLVGAAPEWSIEGDMLAFSAMPADLSTGPDVYLWKVGDSKAVRLTQDHRSFFASWAAADRIVISRLPAGRAGAATASPAAGPVDAITVVMDLASGEQRVANGPSLWLPAVDPSGSTAVAWIGRLRSDGRQVTLHAGGLYLVDWTAIDPFAPPAAAGTGDASANPTATDTPGGTPAAPPDGTPANSTTAPRATPGDASAEPVDGSAPPAPTRSPRHRKPSPTPVASPSPTATPTTAPTASTGTTSDAPAPAVQAVDPQRDETDDPVLDWVVRWSADGSTVGIWVADSAGANWGRLTVTSVALIDGRFTRDSVLGPNLARRAFSMGVDRVAWVAPSDDSDNGDLRIRTWSDHGYGDLRIRSDDAGDGVPSF